MTERSTLSDDRLFDAIERLEAKLTATISAGHLALTQQINTLYELHHKAQLEQERRNSSFITAERFAEATAAIDGLKIMSSRTSGRLDTLGEAISHQNDTIATLRAELASADSVMDARQFTLLNTLTGWLFFALLAFAGPILTLLLSHLVHP